MKVIRYLLKVVGSLLLVIGFATMPIWLFVIYLFSRGPACITQVEKRVTDLYGLDFEMIIIGCWGTSESKITVAKHGEKPEVLLEYDSIARADLPAISMPTKDQIVISLSEVGWVYARRRHWRGIHISYEIGEISNPGNEKSLDE